MAVRDRQGMHTSPSMHETSPIRHRQPLDVTCPLGEQQQRGLRFGSRSWVGEWRHEAKAMHMAPEHQGG